MPDKKVHPLAQILLESQKSNLYQVLESTGALADVGVCINAVVSTDQSERGNRAVIAVISGPIPDDLVESFRTYVNAIIQDYKTSLSQDKFAFFEDKDQDTDES